MPESTKELSGRELDAATAERVMGWERVMLFDHAFNPVWLSDTTREMYTTGTQVPYLVPPGRMQDGANEVGAREVINGLTIGGDQDLPRYSESIEAAMQVVEKMRERGWSFDIYIFPESYSVSAFHSGASNDITEEYLSNMRTRTEDYVCRSFAKALCLAALEASGVDSATLFDLNEGNAALKAIDTGNE